MKKILIIDDEVAVSSVYETALKNAGYEVTLAIDGKSGLEIAQKEDFDLILCDEIMPDMGGNDVIKNLKSDPNKKVQIVVITNFGEENLMNEAKASGAHEYLLKYQMLPDDLVKKVKTLIGDP